MRKLLLPFFALIALGLGLATAQNITKSVQLSQDPTGTIGYDTSNNVYFPAHVLVTGPGTPALTSCGSAPTITGTDTSGTIVGSSNTTACTVTFNKAYLAAPTCVVIAQNPGTSPIAYNTATTGINMTTVTGAVTANYVCSGTK